MRPAYLLLIASASLLGGIAHGEDAPKPAPAAPTKAEREGRRLFDQSVAWVHAGRPAPTAVRDVFVDLMDLSMGRHDGNLRVWYQAPDKLRWALRKEAGGPSSIKVLDGDRMWVSPAERDPARRQWKGFGRLGPEAGRMLAQLREDRDRIARLTRFLSIKSLDGKGVRFEYEGEQTWPRGHHLAGRWLKLKRHAPDGERMALLLARAAGKTLAAAHPFAILQPAAGERPAQHLVLKRWKRSKDGTWPQRIARWQHAPKGFEETMYGFVVRLRVNRGLPAARFRPEGGHEPEKD